MVLGRAGKAVIGAAAGIALLAGGLASSHPAGAFAEWCFDDPVINVNGYEMHVSVGVNANADTVRSNVTAANITVHVPKQATAQLVSSTDTYIRENVTFVYDQSDWQIGHDLHIKVHTEFTGRAATDDKANVQTQMIITSPGRTDNANGHTKDHMDKDVTIKTGS